MKQLEQRLDSREVAEMVGKEHNKLLRDIRNYIEQLGESKIDTPISSQNQPIKQSKTKQCPATLYQRKVANLSHIN